MFLRFAAIVAVVFASPAAAAPTCDDFRRAIELQQASHLDIVRAARGMNDVVGDQLASRALPLAATEALLTNGTAPLAVAVAASLSRLEEATALYREACSS
jgi:hypothetical protein